MAGFLTDIPEVTGDVDVDPLELPGAAFNFQDVTKVFVEAAADMQPGEFVFMEEFTLMDAMSAFEIGEPRLDSGLILNPDEQEPIFDPLTPLLPQELCWILDRAMSYEMEWHEGNLLAHTVFTLQYIHSLPDIDLEFMPFSSIATHDPSRPQELVTMILRACVMGLLKCCDLSWRELSKGSVQDLEDWQAEKCDISLLEGVPVKHVLVKLEEAASWISKTTKIPDLWKRHIHSRILLRKTILDLMQCDIFAQSDAFFQLLTAGREHLSSIRNHPFPEPLPGSPAFRAFDPAIGRHLKTFAPLRIVPVPTPEDTFKSLDVLFDGWQELYLLSKTDSFLTWDTVANLRIWLPKSPLKIPYLRSLTQSTFYDGLLVLNKYSFSWLMDRFFFETMGIRYDVVLQNFKDHYRGSEPLPLSVVERMLYKLLLPHVMRLYLNPSRRRRALVNTLLDWHVLYHSLLEVTTELDPIGVPTDSLVRQMPNCVLAWRLSTIREVVFTGFQLELFSAEEKPLAYLYAARVIEENLRCLDNLLRVIPRESVAHHEMQFQYQLLTALQAMSSAMFVITMARISFDWVQMRANFQRRYKWAFMLEYDDISTSAVAQPDLGKLMPACSDAAHDEDYSPAGSIELAKTILQELLPHCGDGWIGLWAGDRKAFIQSLIDACVGLSDIPSSVKDLEHFNVDRLKWDPNIHPWFPSLSGNGSQEVSEDVHRAHP